MNFNKFNILQLSSKEIMISHQATFSMKGSNIQIPHRYKIRSIKNSKNNIALTTQSHKEQLTHPIIIQKINNERFKYFPLQIDRKQQGRTNSQMHSQQELTNHVQSIHNPKTSQSVTNTQTKITLFKQTYHVKQILFRQPKRCTCGDCEQCIKDFNYFLHLFSQDQSIPKITAKSWCIWRRKPNNKFVYFYGKRIHKVREIASLSKMITAMTTIDYLNHLQYDPKKIIFQVKKSAISIGGTSANLQLGEVVNLYDLLYAMMLPSGNDAAITISQCVGLMAHLVNKKKTFDPYEAQWYSDYQHKNYSPLFIGLMNQKCQKLGMLDTMMYNCHGNDAYDQLKNISTCNQVAKISSEFNNYALLKDIVNTKTYGKWVNTNKLLLDGFEGIKTGITDTAGPCLSAIYKDIIIVVLNSKSMNQRWIEVKKLVKWFINKTNI